MKKAILLFLLINTYAFSQVSYQYDSQYKDEDYCKFIDKIGDDFSDKINIMSPDLLGISFMQVVQKGKTNNYLSVSVPGYSYSSNEKGLYLKFSDGSFFKKPMATVDSEASSNGYIYTSFISLTKDDIQILKTKEIIAKKVGTYQDKYSDGILSSIYAKCIFK
ncbi:hypothetical protein [Epilithonimonas sp. UC225_85]|uniref:hypothetical protein n=1 Tax=Epilithonimonas sp. UC225_85 TaxID=3350167 RepID=UPI0036D20B56